MGYKLYIGYVWVEILPYRKHGWWSIYIL